jgi:hypothetical protein
MSTTATTEVGRQVIHVMRHPEKRVEYTVNGETLAYEMPEFFLGRYATCESPKRRWSPAGDAGRSHGSRS